MHEEITMAVGPIIEKIAVKTFPDKSPEELGQFLVHDYAFGNIMAGYYLRRHLNMYFVRFVPIFYSPSFLLSNLLKSRDAALEMELCMLHPQVNKCYFLKYLVVMFYRAKMILLNI